MLILSHRGYWLKPQEKNTQVAFERSFNLGFGTETDVRDSQGQLVISHDMPTGGEMRLEDFLCMLNDRDLPLALNIKSDGLVLAIKKIMETSKLSNWFVFDMSIPDMRAYLNEGIPVFTRMSEVETSPIWFEKSTGVWLDGFFNIWYDEKVLDSLLASGKTVCLVSPELHGREPELLWERLRAYVTCPKLMLCTDYPERAKKYFGVFND